MIYEIQIIISPEKKEEWMKFAKSIGVTLNQLIRDSVDEYVANHTRPRDIDIPGPYSF